jgi:hypothetical protein
MGSVGPIRRIRQKSNLLPMSGTLSIRGNGMVSNAAQRLTSTEKPVLAGEPLKDNANSNVHGTTFTPVPSKSSEMASKILQQLDVLVSSRGSLLPGCHHPCYGDKLLEAWRILILQSC